MKNASLFPKTRFLLDQAARDDRVPASQLSIRKKDRLLLTHAAGWIDPETKQRLTGNETLFDLASVTKLFTTAAFMKLTLNGSLRLDDPVCSILPDFTGSRPVRSFEEPLDPENSATSAAALPDR